MDKNIWLWIIGIAIVIALGMFIQKSYTIFATLPAGETYTDSGCTFISNTNIVQANNNIETISDFSSSYTSWIAVDWDGDGTKEGYGYYGSTSSTGDPCAGKPVITTTPGGLNVVQYADGTSYNEIGVCGGTQAYRFRDTDSDATDAVLTCTGTCTPSCTGKVCGDNGCGGSCGTCQTGYTCSSGQCIPGTGGCLLTDTNGNNLVDRSELATVIQRWVTGS